MQWFEKVFDPSLESHGNSILPQLQSIAVNFYLSVYIYLKHLELGKLNQCKLTAVF